MKIGKAVVPFETGLRLILTRPRLALAIIKGRTSDAELIKIAARINIIKGKVGEKGTIPRFSSLVSLNESDLKIRIAERLIFRPDILKLIEKGPIEIKRFSFSDGEFAAGAAITAFSVRGYSVSLNYTIKR